MNRPSWELLWLLRKDQKQVDKYLNEGHKEVNANEIMEIITDSYQKVLDNNKRNLEEIGQVNLRWTLLSVLSIENQDIFFWKLMFLIDGRTRKLIAKIW